LAQEWIDERAGREGKDDVPNPLDYHTPIPPPPPPPPPPVAVGLRLIAIAIIFFTGALLLVAGSIKGSAEPDRQFMLFIGGILIMLASGALFLVTFTRWT
jgi:hypothetical protein